MLFGDELLRLAKFILLDYDVDGLAFVEGQSFFLFFACVIPQESMVLGRFIMTVRIFQQRVCDESFVELGGVGFGTI